MRIKQGLHNGLKLETKISDQIVVPSPYVKRVLKICVHLVIAAAAHKK